MTKLLTQKELDKFQEERSRTGFLKARMQNQVLVALGEGNSKTNEIEWQEDDFSVMVWIMLPNGRKVTCRIPGESLRVKLMKRPDERRDIWDTFVHGGI